MPFFNQLGDRSEILGAFGALTDLNTIGWQLPIDSVARGADSVDVVVTLPDPWSVSEENRVGLYYRESGMVARGEQTMLDGQTLAFNAVLVRPGETLALATDGIVPEDVQVVTQGTGDATKAAKTPDDDSPWGGFLGGFAAGSSVLTFAVVGVVAYLLWRDNR